MTKKSPMAKFTLKDFYKMYPTDDACLDYLRQGMVYPEVIKCQHCGRECEVLPNCHQRKVYGCEYLRLSNSLPPQALIFHKSPTPLTVWFYVIYLMAQTRGGISAKQIQRETGVTYKCAWRMCKQVRSMLFEDYEQVWRGCGNGQVLFWRREKNKHVSKRTATVRCRSIKTRDSSVWNG